MLTCGNIRYEMADKSRAVNCRGLGAIDLMVNKLGLAREIDEKVPLLRRHLHYYESGHVLNLAYNALLDGVRLEDIELRRNDEAFLDGLGWAPSVFPTRRPRRISPGASMPLPLKR